MKYSSNILTALLFGLLAVERTGGFVVVPSTFVGNSRTADAAAAATELRNSDKDDDEKGILGTVKGKAVDAKDYVKEKAIDAKDYVKDKASSAKEKVKDVFTSEEDEEGPAEEAGRKLGENIDDLGDDIKESYNDALDDAQDRLQDAKNEDED